MPLIVHAPGGSQWVCRRARVPLGALILRCDESSWSINVSSAELSIHSFVQIIVQPCSDESSIIRSRSLVSAMLKNWLKPADASSSGRNAERARGGPTNNARLPHVMTRHPARSGLPRILHGVGASGPALCPPPLQVFMLVLAGWLTHTTMLWCRLGGCVVH